VVKTWLSPPQVAEQLGVDPSKVIGWIVRGELVGVNVATRATGRPRWRVSPSELAAFLARRQSTRPAAVPKRGRWQTSGVVEFF
jgi:hypothetical protein